MLAVELRRTMCAASDLEDPFPPIHTLSDVPVGVAQRVGCRVRSISCRRLAQRLDHLHRASPGSVSFRSTLAIVRLASSILKPLWEAARALASSASAARRNVSGVAALPSNARSATCARHGLAATPPSARRTAVILPSVIAIAAATLTSANA